RPAPRADRTVTRIRPRPLDLALRLRLRRRSHRRDLGNQYDGRPHASESRPPAAGPEADGPGSLPAAMNPTTSPPPTDGHPPENLDRLLSVFFRGEVPSPWPTLKAPVTLAAPRTAGILPASRLALAASVAALLLG